jgi:hypothetical protein
VLQCRPASLTHTRCRPMVHGCRRRSRPQARRLSLRSASRGQPHSEGLNDGSPAEAQLRERRARARRAIGLRGVRATPALTAHAGPAAIPEEQSESGLYSLCSPAHARSQSRTTNRRGGGPNVRPQMAAHCVLTTANTAGHDDFVEVSSATRAVLTRLGALGLSLHDQRSRAHAATARSA